ncbi:MAG: signal peptide peptidase SppA [Bacteroidales bacterium]
MKAFLRTTLASIVGTLVAITLIFIMGGMLIFSMAISSSSPKMKLEDNSILKLDLSSVIVEQKDNSIDFLSLITNNDIPTVVSLTDILTAIRNAKTEPKIKGIYIKAGYMSIGYAKAGEIHDALLDFKESGKFIYCYAEAMNEKGYYVASVADEIYMHPIGAMEFNGLSSQVMFYTGALEKLGVEMQIVKHGEFKSAVEVYTRTSMSDASREQSKVLLNDIWGVLVKSMSTSKGITVDELNKIANDDALFTYSSNKLVDYGMIDGYQYTDEIKDDLNAKIKNDDEKDDENDDKDKAKYKLISILKYCSLINENKKEYDSKIKIIYADGAIDMGRDGINSEDIEDAIKKAKNDDDVKAIVLRVNSPGGSVFGSEDMWRAVVEAKKEKPVVVTMGDYAASGGYYMSCAADYIFAEPNTITGSIGIYGTIPNLKGLVTDKLGLTFDEVETHENADFIGSGMRGMNEFERNLMQEQIETGYDIFVTRVADGRSMSKDSVMKIAEGRVWSGARAKELGLVDSMGGIEAAIDKAAELAGLEEYSIAESRKQDFFEKFLSNMQMKAEEKAIKERIGEQAYRLLESANNLQIKKEIYAKMPFEFDIE